MTAPQEGEQTSELIVVDKGDRALVTQIFAENGVTATEVDQSDFLDPLTISFVILGTTAAVGLVEYLIDKAKGGTVIDMRTGAPSPQYRSKGLAYGVIQIIAVDGKVTVEVHEPKGLIGQVLDAVVQIVKGAAGGGAQAVAGTVKNALAGSQATAGKATVTVENAA